jgi:hypothetical protein
MPSARPGPAKTYQKATMRPTIRAMSLRGMLSLSFEPDSPLWTQLPEGGVSSNPRLRPFGHPADARPRFEICFRQQATWPKDAETFTGVPA